VRSPSGVTSADRSFNIDRRPPLEQTREAIEDRSSNARVTIPTRAREKIPREGKKTLAS
jgi:hypothetical protein